MGFMLHCRFCSAKCGSLARSSSSSLRTRKFAGNSNVVGNPAEGVSHHVMARSRRERFAWRKIQFNVAAQLADCTVALVRNLAQRVPCGVFEKDVIGAIKTVLVVDEASGFGR